MNAVIRSGRGPFASTIFPKNGPLMYTPTKIELKDAQKKKLDGVRFPPTANTFSLVWERCRRAPNCGRYARKARVEHVDAT